MANTVPDAPTQEPPVLRLLEELVKQQDEQNKAILALFGIVRTMAADLGQIQSVVSFMVKRP